MLLALWRPQNLRTQIRPNSGSTCLRIRKCTLILRNRLARCSAPVAIIWPQLRISAFPCLYDCSSSNAFSPPEQIVSSSFPALCGMRSAHADSDYSLARTMPCTVARPPLRTRSNKVFLFPCACRPCVKRSCRPYANNDANNDANYQGRPRRLQQPEGFRAVKSGAVPIWHDPLLSRLLTQGHGSSVLFSGCRKL